MMTSKEKKAYIVETHKRFVEAGKVLLELTAVVEAMPHGDPHGDLDMVYKQSVHISSGLNLISRRGLEEPPEDFEAKKEFFLKTSERSTRKAELFANLCKSAVATEEGEVFDIMFEQAIIVSRALDQTAADVTEAALKFLTNRKVFNKP